MAINLCKNCPASIAWLQKTSNCSYLSVGKAQGSHSLTSRHEVTPRTYSFSAVPNILTFALLYLFVSIWSINTEQCSWTAKLNDAKIFLHATQRPGSLQTILPLNHWALKVILLCTKEQKHETGNLMSRWITWGSLSHMNHSRMTCDLDTSKTKLCRL